MKRAELVWIMFKNSRCTWTYCLFKEELIHAFNRWSCENGTKQRQQGMNSWPNSSPVKDTAFKGMCIFPSFFLQKLSKSSKAKDHLKTLVARIDLLSNEKIDELSFEVDTMCTSHQHSKTHRWIIWKVLRGSEVIFRESSNEGYQRKH